MAICDESDILLNAIKVQIIVFEVLNKIIQLRTHTPDHEELSKC